MTAQGEAATGDILLEVDDLTVDFRIRRGTFHAVRGASLSIAAGEAVALVGESGSGKSVTALAAMGLIDLPGCIVAGDIRWSGESLVHGQGARRRMERVRGRELAMVPQDPMTSLNPALTVGWQITEVLRRHLGLPRRARVDRAAELLSLVGIGSPRRRLGQYPHELSGGMRQRVMIAMALAGDPKLLIADEPTTALDVTVQAQILNLISDLRQRLDLAVLLITHDLGIVAGMCDRVVVMYGGTIVEEAGAVDLFHRPAHPYTAGLLRSTPPIDAVADRLTSIPGAPPDPRHPPSGCVFSPRCTEATASCHRDAPTLVTVGAARRVRCWKPLEGELR